MKEIDTIRKVLEFYAQGDWNGDPAKKALAALSTIEADAKPQKMSEDARDFAMQILDWTDPLPYYESETKHVNRATALITAHDDAIRRECADRAREWLNENACQCWTEVDMIDIRAAILGKEAEK